MEKEELSILWEDSDIMVVNKPPFWVVNRAESVSSETVADWAEDRIQMSEFRKQPETRELKTFFQRSGVVHRLDKETSGCLLIAKNPTALASLLAQFKERVVKKEYLALVHGRFSPREGTVRLPLSRSRYDREKWEIRYSGKLAETAWKVESYFRHPEKEETFTLLRLFPKTGRTHQIRVHLAHLGHPIFADETYLTRSKISADRALLSHHFLHAEKIGFQTLSGEWQEVSAPLPTDSAKLLRWLVSE